MSRSPKPTPSKAIQQGLIYLGLVFSIAAIAIVGQRYLHLHAQCIIMFLCGAMFLLASFKTPEILYRVVRSTGWFSLIENDSTMCVVLRVLGSVFVLIGGLCLVV